MPQESIRYFFRSIFNPDQSRSGGEVHLSRNTLNKLRIRYDYLACLAIFLIVLLTFFIPPIPQSQHYHKFADNRMFYEKSFLINLLSNIGFLVAGYRGIRRLMAASPDMPTRRMYRLHFFFSFLGGLGAAIYHTRPSNMTLVFERLPMIISTMALLSAITAELVSFEYGRKLMWPLIALGSLSVVYWEYTEILGRGDLRIYGLIQVLQLILIPLMLLRTRDPPSDNVHLWRMVIFVAVARLAEWLDWVIFGLTFHFLNGHAIKHTLFVLAVNEVLMHIKTKVPKPSKEE